MIRIEDVQGKWKHRKTGKIVEVIGFPGGASQWLQLRHESGRVTKKALHYFIEEYERVPEAARVAAHQERVERAQRLFSKTSPYGLLGATAECDGDVITFDFESHKFSITEIGE